MKQISFGLIGWGWRAQFYYRITTLLPERFRLTSVLCRSEDKARDIAEEFGVKTVCSIEEWEQDKPQFAVLCIKRGHVSDYLKTLFERNIPVLTETPPAETIEELVSLWEAAQKADATLQVAEQYRYQPLYAAWNTAIEAGLIGQVQNINLSSLHGYHGASIIRQYLGAGMSGFTVYGKQYEFRLTETFGRGGEVYDGEIVPSFRNRLTFEFDHGPVAFFDFSDPAQYHSFIRTRQLNVQGTRGEIDDLTIRYLTDENVPVTQTVNRIDMGVYNNQEWSHKAIFLGERCLYRNPFPHARLNDDEIAVATCVAGMAEYLNTGKEVYSLQDALQDTYLSILMDEAMKHPNKEIVSQPMPWMVKES